MADAQTLKSSLFIKTSGWELPRSLPSTIELMLLSRNVGWNESLVRIPTAKSPF